MKILKSKKGIPLPMMFFISDKSEITEIPIGTPYFVANENMEDSVVALLEFEVLYRKAMSTGLPFNFNQILNQRGFSKPSVNAEDCKVCVGSLSEDLDDSSIIRRAIFDHSIYVDISLIKNLNIFPIWMDDLEEAISTNINAFATFDSNMYNKKLEGMYGGIAMTSPTKNLIIIDISGSIPRKVSSTCLVLARNMAESFYADILITGSKSTLYEYENISELNPETIYGENQMDNDQVYFKELITSSDRKYDTLIVFGDEDSPGYTWRNEFNRYTVEITDEEGKKMNRWKVNNIISFHAYQTYSYDDIVAAYGRWFEADNVKHIRDWVKDLR